jgi:lysophospholipase L1-like esterase
VTLPLDWLVRFQRPRAVLALHDLAGECDAQAFGIPLAELRARRRALADAAHAAAPDGPSPFRAGEVVVGLGDSITSDALSWFELIAAAGEQTGARFVNAGISGDTSADLRKRVFRVAALRPDRVLAMIGTNDCQRHGPLEERLVSAGETLRNLLALDAALRRAGARVLWVAPPPVDEAALGAELAARGLRFRAGDVRGVATAMREVSADVVVCDGFAGWEDGVHPSLAGQRLIAEAVLRALAGRASPDRRPPV